MKAKTVALARNIERRYGSNYYIATLFLPPRMRDAVFVLYAFVRIPDEIVDNPKPGSDPAALLQDWKQNWIAAFETGVSDNQIMLATREIFLTYEIPFGVSIEFIDAMIRDLTQDRYETYDDLRSYMRGSAEVVGVMLTHVFGYSDKTAFSYGEKLGEAMQLTNFLRDIHEDYTERNRIYLPQEDMRTFGVTEAMLKNKQPSAELTELLKFEIKRARAIFADAQPGIVLLLPECQKAVILASRFYEGILDEIERRSYDIFTAQAKLSFIKKCNILIKTYVTK